MQKVPFFFTSFAPRHQVQQRCEALGIRNVQLFSAVPNRSALDAIGATDCGIFRPQLVFDDADSSSGEFRDVQWIGWEHLHRKPTIESIDVPLDQSNE